MPTANATVDTGQGITLVMTTSAWSPEITSIQPPSFKRETHDTTHLSTAVATGANYGNQTKIVSDITEIGECEIEGHFNPNLPPPVNSAAEVITVTFPLTSSSFKRAAKWRWTGAIVDFTPGKLDKGKMTFTAKLSVHGSVLKIAASTSTSVT